MVTACGAGICALSHRWSWFVFGNRPQTADGQDGQIVNLPVGLPTGCVLLT